MSSFLANKIVKTINNAKSKYTVAKSQYKMYEEELKTKKYMNKENKTPDYIKSNPFYLGNLIKSKFYEAFRFLFESFKNKPKLITQEGTKNIPIHIKKTVNQLTNYTKKTALSIIDTSNKLILKLTNGYLDLRKISNSSLSPMAKNFYMTISQNLNSRNLIIIFTKMGNSIKWYKKETIKNLNKYRDNDIYNDYLKKNNKFFNWFNTKLDAKKNQNKSQYETSNFFTRKIKNYFDHLGSYGGRANFDSKINKINNYIKSPWYKQKFHLYTIKAKNIWKNRSQAGGVMNYSYYKEKLSTQNLTKVIKNFNYSNARNFVGGGIKRQFRKIIFYFISIVTVYYSIKYFLHRLFNHRSDKNLEEALNAVKELKVQNQELMKYNRDLIEKIMEGKNK
jgi:hypothetical protein